jgi:phosphatidylserine/phosphatidylglycerophosphate/cardiolipin synthase-like enzyme
VTRSQPNTLTPALSQGEREKEVEKEVDAVAGRAYDRDVPSVSDLGKSMLLRILLSCLLAGVALGCDRNGPSANDSSPGEEGIAVYFQPNDCRKAIIRSIDNAEQRIDVQAYSFTSNDIAKALVAAHQRGVKVRVIIDADKADKKSELGRLLKKDVDTYIDSEHEKAHNKVIIIDGQTVITGSFNFNDAGGESAENMLVIRGKPKLIRAYEDNFLIHLKHAEKAER